MSDARLEAFQHNIGRLSLQLDGVIERLDRIIGKNRWSVGERPILHPGDRGGYVRPILRLGHRGDFVRELQALLGVPWLSCDGIFGDATHHAVLCFQHSKRLALRDGIVGPATWIALLGQKYDV